MTVTEPQLPSALENQWEYLQLPDVLCILNAPWDNLLPLLPSCDKFCSYLKQKQSSPFYLVTTHLILNEDANR